MTGRIITVEGLDGSGKSTQHKLLVDRLKKEGYPVEEFGFPQYDKPTGKIIEKFLYGGLLNDPVLADPISSGLLFSYDRLEAKERLLSWLDEGKNIILDRYMESNWAYQSAKVSAEQRIDLISTFKEIEVILFGMPCSDIVIYLDAPVEFCVEAMNEIGRRLDLHESNENYLRDVRSVYNELAKNKDNWIKVLRHESYEKRLRKEVVHEIIWERIKPHIA